MIRSRQSYRGEKRSSNNDSSPVLKEMKDYKRRSTSRRERKTVPLPSGISKLTLRGERGNINVWLHAGPRERKWIREERVPESLMGHDGKSLCVHTRYKGCHRGCKLKREKEDPGEALKKSLACDLRCIRNELPTLNERSLREESSTRRTFHRKPPIYQPSRESC